MPSVKEGGSPTKKLDIDLVFRVAGAGTNPALFRRIGGKPIGIFFRKR